ncbi:hypothetical protein DPMN_028740 [Dreissena polymorpha]|uniref:Uncharacterized protein n=1 Tax=Dreissena polymorpha TaxID=45954 RepID=A0A9D4LXT5_DREPO|nr:hypothetical protein DPMN_028740 [Dreissena polymorpha]
MWVRPWLSEARRQQQRHFDAFLTREFRNEEISSFQNNLRMPQELFDEILEIISQVISLDISEMLQVFPTQLEMYWYETQVILACIGALH